MSLSISLQNICYLKLNKDLSILKILNPNYLLILTQKKNSIIIPQPVIVLIIDHYFICIYYLLHFINIFIECKFYLNKELKIYFLKGSFIKFRKTLN
jgi:hypothetical protein